MPYNLWGINHFAEMSQEQVTPSRAKDSLLSNTTLGLCRESRFLW